MTTTPSGEPVRRTELVVLLGITAIAAALRIYKVGVWPMYGDELLTVSHIEAWDKHVGVSPLAYLPVVGMVKLFGTEVWAWRLWACLVGIITVPLLYWTIRGVGGRRMALWGACLLALAPWHIAQSQMARHYPLQLLFSLYTVYATYRALEEDSPRYYLLSPLFGLLAVLTRPSSIYVMFVVFAYGGLLVVWPALRPPVLRWRRLVTLGVAHGILVLLAFRLTKVYGEGGEVWGHSPLHVLLTTAYYLTVPAVLVAAAAFLFGLRGRSRLAVVLGLYGFVPIAMIAATALFRSAIGAAAFLVLPGILVLCAWGMARVEAREVTWGRRPAALVGIALLGAFLAADYEYFTFAHGYRAPVEAASGYVRDHLAPGDEVYIISRGDLREMRAVIGQHVAIGYWPAPLDRAPELSHTTRTWVMSEDILSTWNVPDPSRAWLDKNADLVTVIPAYIGPRSRSIWIYLYVPPGLQPEASGPAFDPGAR